MAFLKKIKLPNESDARDIYDAGAIRNTEKGQANGVAELGSNGKVLNSQLPSYVDTESDPVFLASAAHGISSSDISNWNNKQNALTAGTGISIINGVISCTFADGNGEAY